MLTILAKLVSESLLSLYPVILKKIKVSIVNQIWTRLISYFIVSSLLIDRDFIKTVIFNRIAILFSAINFMHIVTTYIGFKILDSGVALSVFLTFPIMILIMETKRFDIRYLIILLGLFLLSFDNKKIDENKEKIDENKEKGYKNRYWIGIPIMLLSALTEALIFFCVRRIHTTNSWNHMFIGYLYPTILFTVYFIYYYCKNVLWSEGQKKHTFHRLTVILLLINCAIGTVGYFLRFYSAYRLDAYLYSVLSYFLIITGYLYGYYIDHQIITWNKILGTVIIVISSIFILRK